VIGVGVMGVGVMGVGRMGVGLISRVVVAMGKAGFNRGLTSTRRHFRTVRHVRR